MPDITIPTFAITSALQVADTTQLDHADASVYSTETASDYYVNMLVYYAKSDGSLSVVNTPDNAAPNLAALWTSIIGSDGVYTGYATFCLLYGQEAVPGTFVKGDTTYYNAKFYLATENITGSTDPSSGTGNDADFIELTDIIDHISYILHTPSVNFLAEEYIKSGEHEQRKIAINKYKNGCGCEDEDTLNELWNLRQGANTEFTLNNLLEAQKNVELAIDILEAI